MNERKARTLQVTQSGGASVSESLKVPSRHLGLGQQPFDISGNLSSLEYGYPLVGLAVHAEFLNSVVADGAAESRDLPSESVLGTDDSGPSGEFRITFIDTAAVRQKICLLSNCEEVHFRLKVYASATRTDDSERRDTVASELYFVSEPLNATTRFPVNLEVPIPVRPILPTAWETFAERLKRARISSLHSIARQLLLIRPSLSLFGDWDLGTRHSMLIALEEAFLDPQGDLKQAGLKPRFRSLTNHDRRQEDALHFQRSSERIHDAYITAITNASHYESIFVVDRVVDLNDLTKGDVANAVNRNAFIDGDLTAAGTTTLPVAFDQAEESLIPYRNYLLKIFTADATSAGSAAFNEYGDLENRFHQNFGTTDLDLLPVNGLIIPIVREILISDPDSAYGFGLDPGSLPSEAGKHGRQYLDELIALSGLSARQLGLRYRLSLERPDGVLSCKVSENIATLQGFYRDSFQDLKEPHFIYPPDKRNRAPFFLQYDEWLRYQAPFYGENFYNAKHPFLSDVLDSERALAKTWSATQSAARWFQLLLDVQDKMTAGHQAYGIGQYGIARTAYHKAGLVAEEAVAMGVPPDSWGHDGYPFSTVKELVDRLDSGLKGIKNESIKTMQELASFENGFGSQPSHNEPLYPYEFGDWLTESRERLQYDLLHLMIYQIPLCLGDCALAAGDYEEAVNQYSNFSPLTLGHAIAENYMGYLGGHNPPYGVHGVKENHTFFPNHLFKEGGLPYTVSGDNQVRTESGYEYPRTPIQERVNTTSWGSAIAEVVIPSYTNPMEIRFYRLRFANALLEWADVLYRTNESGNIARARELYKAVYWVHDWTPPVFPDWPKEGISAVTQNNNPAIRCQLLRAQRGLYQIEAGLNYYGCSEEVVPAIRYSTLKEAADHFATAAQSAQKDFLVCMTNIERILEQTLRDDLAQANMLQKALLQGKIAGEQAQIAQAGVEQAKQQVASIEVAIQAKQKEIAEDDSFWGQVTDFFNGFKSAVSSLPGVATDAAKLPKEYAGLEAWGATTGPMVGFGIFVYAGYSSISSMCDEDNRLRGELNTLMNQTLPRAIAQVAAREREVNIANLHGLIAGKDAEFARSLNAALHEFQHDRFLNREFWGKVAGLMKRVMRRYIELGARYAWLAERALAYEQDRPVNIVRFDYFPAQLQGVSGADLLQMDLNELEATRLNNLKQTVPVKRIYSLLQDFPLAYGQFKKTGHCSFRTEEKSYQVAYPGLYGYRIRAVTLETVSTTPVSSLRGLLVNHGFSMISRFDGTSHPLVRFPESAPFSDFRLEEDMAVYGLPDECLHNFEGSGIDTFWDLEFAPQANPSGFEAVADVLITFDLRANYSAALHKEHLQTQPKDVHRTKLVSARRFQADALKELRNGKVATLPFNLAELGFPKLESGKKIANLIILMVGCHNATIQAKLRWGFAHTVTTFQLVDGMAFSKAKPLVNPKLGPSPLDGLLGEDVEQTFELIVDPAENPGVDFSRVDDFILGIEYTALVST